jgi:hypothetical protein
MNWKWFGGSITATIVEGQRLRFVGTRPLKESDIVIKDYISDLE